MIYGCLRIFKRYKAKSIHTHTHTKQKRQNKIELDSAKNKGNTQEPKGGEGSGASFCLWSLSAFCSEQSRKDIKAQKGHATTPAENAAKKCAKN